MMTEIETDDYVPQHEFSGWHIEDSTYEACNLSYQKFFENHLLKNLPCIVKNVTTTWESSEKWIKDDCINYEYLRDTYGDLKATVADCSDILDFAQCTSNMKVSEFLCYMQKQSKDKILYLKDLHLKKLRPNDNFYKVPEIFTSDWLNEYAHDKNEDDFKFVYIGPKGSWTPLHADVYNSFSWSANIIGRKKWILFPPGEEIKLYDNRNKLQLIFDPEKNVDVQHYVIIQEKGEAIFVPSGWYHQVENQLDTISINHNWNNGCNIHFMWKVLNQSLLDLELEIGQFSESPDYIIDYQCLLKALCGANHNIFIDFISYMAKKRLMQLEGQVNENEMFCFGMNHVKFDLKMIYNLMQSIMEHSNCKDGKVIISSYFIHLSREIDEVLIDFKVDTNCLIKAFQ